MPLIVLYTVCTLFIIATSLVSVWYFLKPEEFDGHV